MGSPAPRSPRTLRELAESLGIDPAEADRAGADGTLGLLIVEHVVVPEPGVYTEAEVLARSGLGADAKRFWRALGFPEPAPDERIFSQVDLEMLQVLDAMLRLELIETDVALQLARVIGSSMQRVAQSQIDAIEARVDAELTEVDEQLAVQRAGMLMPTVPRVLEYAWRRHVQSATRRRMVRDHLAADGQQARCVGFADLVGFTSLSQQLDDADLAAVVNSFETTAYDIVAEHNGRVVKMIGDEVMFEVDNPAAGVEIALDLADAFHRAELVSDVRVGLAYGPALAREGDLYGPTVNLAARLVGIAYAGAVVTSAEVREALGDDARFHFRSLRARHLKHIGRVQLHTVRRAGDTAESMAERARRRRGLLRDRVTELVEKAVPALVSSSSDADEKDEEEE
jgi:adenylate cyclase